jgi:hypothetical protein
MENFMKRKEKDEMEHGTESDLHVDDTCQDGTIEIIGVKLRFR